MKRNHRATEAEVLNVGLYPLPQAARLIGVHPNQLAYWVGERGDAPSVVKRRLEAQHVLTFAELIELHFVKLFSSEGVPLQTIRRASRAAAKKYHADYPFSVKRFDTDGRTIFATLIRGASEEDLVEDLRHGQLVFEKIIRPFFHKLEFVQPDGVGRYWPLERSGRVVLDPARSFGQPIDADSGVPTAAIHDAIQADGGQDAATVAQWFKLPVEAVLSAVQFERSLCC